MLIVCPNCATSYRIEPSSLGTAGRSVRCARCRSIWFAHETPEYPAATEHARDGDRVTAASFTAPDHARILAEPPRAAVHDPAAPRYKPEPDVISTDGRLPPSPARETPIFASKSAPEATPPRAPEPAGGNGAPVPLRIGEQGIPPITAATLDQDIESFIARRDARRTARRRRNWTLPGLPTAIAVLVVANITLIAGRTSVVKILPQTASLYAAVGLPVNLRGLVFNDVVSTTEIDGGAPVLVVKGTIVSASKRTVEVPRLRFSVRNQRGQEVYAWTEGPSRTVLPPGESLAFRSRLASPTADAHDVTVRFFNRRDRVAGLQEGG